MATESRIAGPTTVDRTTLRKRRQRKHGQDYGECGPASHGIILRLIRLFA